MTIPRWFWIIFWVIVALIAVHVITGGFAFYTGTEMGPVTNN